MNIITSMAFSKRFNNWNNPNQALEGSDNLAADIRFFFWYLRPSNPVIGLRALSKLPNSKLPEFKASMGRLRAFLDKIVSAREAASAPAPSDFDFVDMMLQARKDDSEMRDLDSREIVSMMLDFLIAGTDTTSGMASGLCRHLANEQELQQQLHDEIKSVVGLDRMIEIGDLDKLPLLSACVNEELRLWPVAPTTLLHVVTSDFQLGQYKIKEGVCPFHHADAYVSPSLIVVTIVLAGWSFE